VCVCLRKWERRNGALTWLESGRVGLVRTGGECVAAGQHAALSCGNTSLLLSHCGVFSLFFLKHQIASGTAASLENSPAQ